MKKRKSQQNSTHVATGNRPPKRVSGKTLRRRRKIKHFLGFAALAVAIGAGFYFAMNTLFVVKQITVTGSEIFTEKEILEFMAIPQEQNIFTLKADELEEGLYKEFTYLESAQITKRMPDRVEVKLTDSAEYYYTQSEIGCKVYSQSFKLLRNANEPPENAVLLALDTEDENSISTAKTLIDLFEKYELEQITAITVEGDSVINATYADRFEIEFGTLLEIEYKIKLCKKILEDKIPSGESGTIDATTVGEAVYKRQ